MCAWALLCGVLHVYRPRPPCQVRDMVLKFFNADPAEYQVVFTKSATDALKTVGETFPWTQGSMFRWGSWLGLTEGVARARRVALPTARS